MSGRLLTPSGRVEKEKQLKEAQKKLEELSQYEQESLVIRDKASEIKRTVEEMQTLDLQLKRLEETGVKKFSSLAGIEKIPPDLLKRYEEGLQNKQNELNQMEDEKIDIENQIVGVGTPDPFKDRSLQIGLGVTALSLLLPVVVTLHGPFRHLFPAGIFSGIGLAVKAYLHLNKLISLKDDLQRRRAGLNEKTHQFDKKFEKENKEIIELIKKTGAKDVAELKGLQRAYQNHLRSMQESAAKREALLKRGSVEDLENQRQELEKKAKTFEDKLRENEGLTQEVYRLQDEVRSLPDAGELSIDLESSLPAYSLPSGALSLASENLSPLSLFLPRALAIGKERGVPLPLDQIQKQADILSSLFSPDKKREIHLNELGEVKLGQAETNHLSSGTADQIFLCVALPTWDRFAAVPFPLVLDDPLISIDPQHQEVALELLRGVSKKRQVLLFTVFASPSQNGDHRIVL
jgi:Mg2+ and Co2+ transporter CorA